MPYSEPLWGIDIPFIYQTEKIYTIYCLGLSVWFLLLCITGVIASLKNKKILPLIISVLIILSIFLVIFLNGRYEL